jgi:antitoxin StbD
MNIEKITKAIEADAGETLPDLRQALAEAKAGIGRVTITRYATSLQHNQHSTRPFKWSTIRSLRRPNETIMEAILADQSVGISELKLNPNAVIEAAHGQAVAILNRNKPVAYLIPADAWEAILDRLDDIKLVQIVKEREGQAAVKVNIDDL